MPWHRIFECRINKNAQTHSFRLFFLAILPTERVDYTKQVYLVDSLAKMRWVEKVG